jgi:hypothetical protein
MSNSNRRQFLKSILSNLVQAAGTVVVASAAASIAKAQGTQSEEAETASKDVQERADRLAEAGNFQSQETLPATTEFLNGGFRNGPLGAFRNAPLGSFRNSPVLGGFRNSPLGSFGNGALGNFGNRGWPNGGWGSGFRNGGWPNVGWRNW